MKYKLIKNPFGEIVSVCVIDGNLYIPFAPDNTDYQAYLTWLDEGGVPLPADE
jgi:hypothetical protein